MTNEKEEKKGLGIRELVEIVGVMVTILIAGTSLLSASGYVPLWFVSFLQKRILWWVETY